MAPEDAAVATYLWKIITPITFVLIIHLFMRGKYKRYYNKIYALWISKFAVRYNQRVGGYKESLFEPLRTSANERSTPLKILEIGAGSGANFEFYPPGTDVVCLEPKPEFKHYIDKGVRDFPHVNVIDFVVQEAEDMSEIKSDSFDAVVCTLVLCSVSDVDRVLREVKRVLKPGGKFYYLEHVYADWQHEKILCIIQSILSPLWGRVADGCLFNKKTWIHIKNAGFSQVDQECFNIKGTPHVARIIRRHLKGIATK